MLFCYLCSRGSDLDDQTDARGGHDDSDDGIRVTTGLVLGPGAHSALKDSQPAGNGGEINGSVPGGALGTDGNADDGAGEGTGLVRPSEVIANCNHFSSKKNKENRSTFFTIPAIISKKTAGFTCLLITQAIDVFK